MLLIEKLSRDAIVDAVWTIERLNEVGYRAIELNEAIDKGILSEGKSALLLEDLEKAKQELTQSGQNSLEKVDKAVTYIDNLITVSQSGGSGDDIFAQLSLSFGKAKEIVAEFSALKLDGKISNIKAFFSEGGKVAAIMDALAQEMNILSSFVKMISAAFAQTIRIMQAIPDGFKNTPTGRNKDVSLETYIDEAAGKGSLSDFSEFDVYEVDSKELKGSLLDIMEDIKAKSGGSGIFSFKGVKNFFSSNSKSMGIGAFVGGLAALAIPVAGPMALAAVGAGIGLGISTSKRTPENPAKAYDTNMKTLAQLIMDTNVAKLEGLLPGFVKAVKGVKPGEFAKYAEEAAKAIQAINDGFNVDDTVEKFINDYGEKFPVFKELRDADADLLKSIIRDTVVAGSSADSFDEKVKELDGTTLQEPLKTLYKELILGEGSWHAGDLILENNSMAHSYTMSELLFEQPKQQKKNRKKSSEEKAAAKKKYKAAKSNIKSFGKEQLNRAEKKPTKKAGYETSVDQRERSINKKLKDVNRKKQITKIANDFEEKIRKIDAEDTPPVAEPPEEQNNNQPPTEQPDNPERETQEPDEFTPEATDPEFTPEVTDDSNEETKTDDADESSTGDDSYKLPNLEAFNSYSNSLGNRDSTMTDNQRKFLAVLYGDKIDKKLAKRLGINKSTGGSSGALDMLGLGESYDRRLLRLSGIK